MKIQFACLMVICFLKTAVFSTDGFHGGALSDINRRENYAVVNLKVGEGVTNGDAELISDRLRAEIFDIGSVNVMERNQMQDILKEQGFQQSGATCTDEACLVQLGQMLGVQFLVAGSLGRLGTLYMVNVRAIDVQTGKIVRVVSVDVKGNIEDLVDHLPRIAMQLTGVAKKPKQTVITNMAVKDTSKTVVVEAKPGNLGDRPTNDVEVTENGSNDKNRNRSGVGIVFDIFGKPGRLISGHDSNDKLLLFDFDSIGSMTPLTKFDYDITRPPVINLGLKFLIKAGALMEVDITPAITLASEKYTFNESNVILNGGEEKVATITYTVPSLAAGITLTKRMLPLKLNAGAFVNFLVPVTTFEYSITPATTDSNPISRETTITSFAIGFAARGGVEYVIAQRIGITADLVFNWARYDVSFDFDDTDEPVTMQTVVLPMLGFGLGVNYYF
jgi:TolB-like protein